MQITIFSCWRTGWHVSFTLLSGCCLVFYTCHWTGWCVCYTYGSLSLCLWIDCSVAPLPDYHHLYQVLSMCVRERILTRSTHFVANFLFFLSFFSLSLSFSLLCYSNCNYTCNTQFMQVGVDVKCMHTNFVGGASSVSEILLPFQIGQNFLSDHGL